MSIAFIEVRGKSNKMWVNVNNIECFYPTNMGRETHIKMIGTEMTVGNSVDEIQQAIREVIS